MTDSEKQEVERMMEQDKYFRIVMDEYAKCSDMDVLQWFDLDSEKMMKKKARVLHAINEGKEVSEEDFYSILELYPRDENGKIIPQ